MKKIKFEFNNANGEPLAGLLEITDRCPVHRTLENDPQIVTELIGDNG